MFAAGERHVRDFGEQFEACAVLTADSLSQ